MIHQLRKRHRMIWIAIGLLIPLLVGISLSHRRYGAEVSPLPGIVAGINIADYETSQDLPDLFAEQNISARILTHVKNQSRVLELTPAKALPYPDILVYLGGEIWPGETILLGGLSGTQACRFSMPATGGNFLHIYSLGHVETIAKTQIPAITPGGKP